MQEDFIRLYLHIPFCKRKCNYCDFVSFAGKEAFWEAYTAALCNEIAAWGEVYGKRRAASLYIGGGTPSLLPVPLMQRITDALYQSFAVTDTKAKRKLIGKNKSLRPVTEFSVECNPGTVDKDKMKAYKKMGINRISFGLQSADAQDLQVLGRIHSFADFVEAFEAAREAGFDNINVDLMQAIPKQILDSWQRTLALLTTWKPEHISAYSLIVEEGTPFFEQQQVGALHLPDEDTERRIYYYTKDFLTKCGYGRYEISNYAVRGFACQHNIGYWKRDSYLGMGLNAASMMDNVRWKNTADLDAYLAAFANLEQAKRMVETAVQAAETDASAAGGASLICEKHRLSHKEQMEEYLFLGLRMTEGINKQAFFETFQQDFDFTYGDVVFALKTKGLLEEKEGWVYLSERGVDVSNTVLAEFLLD